MTLGQLAAVMRDGAVQQVAAVTAPGGERLLCARVGSDYAVRDGQMVELALAPQSSHYFDLTTGNRYS